MQNISNRFPKISISTPESLAEAKENYEQEIVDIEKDAEPILSQYALDTDMATHIEGFNTTLDDRKKELNTAVEDRIKKMTKPEKKRYEQFIALDLDGRKSVNKKRQELIESKLGEINAKTEDIKTQYEKIKTEVDKLTNEALTAAIALDKNLNNLLKERNGLLDEIQKQTGVSLDASNHKVGDKSYTIAELAPNILDSDTLITDLKEKIFIEKINKSLKYVKEAATPLEAIHTENGLIMGEKVITAMKNYNTLYNVAQVSIDEIENFYNTNPKNTDKMERLLDNLKEKQVGNKKLFDKTPEKIKEIMDNKITLLVSNLPSDLKTVSSLLTLNAYDLRYTSLYAMTAENYTTFLDGLKGLKSKIENIEAKYASEILKSEYKDDLLKHPSIITIKSEIDTAK